MGKKITSEERTNIFGDKYTVHYDEHGNKLGTSEKRKNIFGDEYVAHYDKNSNKTGTSENRTNIFGDKYTAHYDKNSNRTGTSENRTNIFGDNYVAHYDNYGNKVGESYNRTDIFGNSYSETYTNGTSNSYSNSYSNNNYGYNSGSNINGNYNNSYSASTPSKPKPREQYKMVGGHDSVSEKELKSFESVRLSDDMYKVFVWYASGLLKSNNVHFSRTLYGSGLWQIKKYSESYESKNHYKDEDTTTYLCEHGFAWEIEVRTGSEIGNYEHHSCEKERINESLIDYLLNKHGIAFCSKDFYNMPSELKDNIISEYDKNKSAIDAGRKSISRNEKIEYIYKNPRYYQNANSNPFGAPVFVFCWVIVVFSMFFINDSPISLSYMASGILAVIGLWLVTRFDEYLKYTIPMSGLMFACTIGSWAFVNPTMAIVLGSILLAIVIFVCFSRTGPYNNLRLTVTSKESFIVALLSEVIAVFNLPPVANSLNETGAIDNASTLVCAVFYVILAIWGLVGLIGLVVHMYKNASEKNTNVETMIMVRSHLWCLLYGLIPPVLMLIFQFAPALLNFGIGVVSLLTVCIVTIKKQSFPKMASKLAAFPTIFCIFLGMFTEGSETIAIKRIFESFYCGFILNFLASFGKIVRPVTYALFAPVSETINYILDPEHSIPDRVEIYISMYPKVAYLFAFIVVSFIAFIGCAFAIKKNAPKKRKKQKKK